MKKYSILLLIACAGVTLHMHAGRPIEERQIEVTTERHPAEPGTITAATKAEIDLRATQEAQDRSKKITVTDVTKTATGTTVGKIAGINHKNQSDLINSINKQLKSSGLGEMDFEEQGILARSIPENIEDAEGWNSFNNNLDRILTKRNEAEEGYAFSIGKPKTSNFKIDHAQLLKDLHTAEQNVTGLTRMWHNIYLAVAKVYSIDNRIPVTSSAQERLTGHTIKITGPIAPAPTITGDVGFSGPGTIPGSKSLPAMLEGEVRKQVAAGRLPERYLQPFGFESTAPSTTSKSATTPRSSSDQSLADTIDFGAYGSPEPSAEEIVAQKAQRDQDTADRVARNKAAMARLFPERLAQDQSQVPQQSQVQAGIEKFSGGRQKAIPASKPAARTAQAAQQTLQETAADLKKLGFV